MAYKACTNSSRYRTNPDHWALRPWRIVSPCGSGDGLPLHPEDLIRVDRLGVRSFSRAMAVDLTVDGGCFASTLKEVVEYSCKMAFSKGRRQRYAETALEILLNLVKEISFLLVDAARIDDLLKRAAWKKIGDEA